MQRIHCLAVAFLLCMANVVCLAAEPKSPVDVAPLFESIHAVGPGGAGQAEASRAWRALSQLDAEQLPRLLAELDHAGPLAANWLLSAIDAVAERALDDDEGLPNDRLEQFVLEREHAPRARRMAYEWLARADAAAADRLMPAMLDDPSVELRRDAVARVIDAANERLAAGETEAAVPLFEQALVSARDLDQVQALVEQFKKFDRTVDLPRHFGFVGEWQVIGPFDNTGEKGFDVAYPPEQEINLDAVYNGKSERVDWSRLTTDDDYGKVDLNAALGKDNGVVGYAAAFFTTEEERPVELRLTSVNAVKVWLNGELLAEHEIYHSGSQFDQYAARGVLTAGRNVILVKVCQNEQTDSWAQDWQFQLRVCDASGTAVLSTDRPPAPVRTAQTDG